MPLIDFIENKKIGLTLSGGGVRAVAFHTGVLKYLAERRLLEQVSYISSVSGGTLLTGLIYTSNNNSWPTSAYFIEESINFIKKSITQNPLINKRSILKNIQNIHKRCELIEKLIKKNWKIYGSIGDFPLFPIWSINGSSAENGVRFRIKIGSENSGDREKYTMGDYATGYADASDMPIAKAMAMSAAFPGLIGPLKIDTRKHNFLNKYKKDNLIHHPILKIYDGGLYDNLGIEPVFDCGEQKLKQNKEIEFLLVSDAGFPFQRRITSKLLFWKRIADILQNQVTSIRIRSFVNYIKKNRNSGVYLRIGTNHKEIEKKYNVPLTITNHLNEIEINKCKNYKTTLSKMSEDNFDLIMKHGYETFSLNDSLWLGSEKGE